jgi:hypothetical protein
VSTSVACAVWSSAVRIATGHAHSGAPKSPRSLQLGLEAPCSAHAAVPPTSTIPLILEFVATSALAKAERGQRPTRGPQTTIDTFARDRADSPGQEHFSATLYLGRREIFLPRQKYPHVAKWVAHAAGAGAVEHFGGRLNLFGARVDGAP